MTPYKTWIEIDRGAVAHNVRAFRDILKQGMSFPRKRESRLPQLWAVVKSNAYGHGLILFSKLADTSGVNGFCVDSVIEGVKLRRAGIRKPILVLGPTLSRERLALAAEEGITVTASSREGLALLRALRRKPQFHVKVDTGMHRQGLLPDELPAVIRQIANGKARGNDSRFALRDLLKGIYTHFAAPSDRVFTRLQLTRFGEVAEQLTRAGFKDLIRHAAGTGGALAEPRAHLDAVRIGAGLYGFIPSSNSESFTNVRIRGFENSESIRNSLIPVLSWRTMVSEVKVIEKGDSVGYDRTFRARRRTRLAIIPIGYWHGLDRRAGRGGEVLIRGRHARMAGNISMDLAAVDATGIPVRAGDRVTLIGGDGRSAITPEEFARQNGVIAYEALTRLNPLVERVVRG